MAKSEGYCIESGLEQFIENYLSEKRAKDKDFANARGVRNCYENVLEAMAERLAPILYRCSEQDLFLIKKQDFK
jgi:hypothetical protein